MASVRLIVVNYHYIREEIPGKGIYPIRPRDFERQLDEIHENGYAFVSLEALHRFIEGDASELPEKACLITFDDGLQESFDNGLAVLDRKGIPAAFYVITDPLMNNYVLDVHKLHLIISEVDTEVLLEDLGAHEVVVEEAVLKDQYYWDELDLAKFKYVLNFKYPEDQKSEKVNGWFESYIPNDELTIARRLYMTRQQLQDLSNRGYLGTHTSYHHPLAKMDTASQRADIQKSIDYITYVTGSRVQSITYPYGGITAVDDNVASVSADLGLVSGFTMERGVNTADDLQHRSLLLKRFDMNDVYGGKSAHLYEDQL